MLTSIHAAWEREHRTRHGDKHLEIDLDNIGSWKWVNGVNDETFIWLFRPGYVLEGAPICTSVCIAISASVLLKVRLSSWMCRDDAAPGLLQTSWARM